MKNIFFILLIAFNNPLMASTLGKETYELTCKICRDAPRFAVGLHAPEAFNKKDWAARFKNAEIEAKKNPDQI